MASDQREHDLVLFGATGFTGGLTAEYLARHAPPGARWALAGRSLHKLEAVRERLAGIAPAAADVPLLVADVEDRGSMQAVAHATRAVITTVGPFITFGEPLVAACAAAGTDYADLTGEPEFVDRMFIEHDGRAQESGARLLHCCGFDSIPHDLGAQFTVEQLPEGVPLTVQGFVRAEAQFSGGTYQSVVTGLGRARQTVAAQRERARREPAPDPGRRVGGLRPRPRREPVIDDAWAVPLPTIDPAIVLRSARAQPRYGPDFRYGHNAWVKHLPVAVAAGAGLTGVLLLAQLPPTRRLLSKAVAAGTGPSPQRRARSTFAVRFLGEGGGRRVVCEVAGGDPGYDETAKMLAETGLCLAFDDTPSTAGQVTTAHALGPVLRRRLVHAGLAFRVLEADAG
jgi:saccharopine dehydrogenase (NAD+, L-glutamate forming)